MKIENGTLRRRRVPPRPTYPNAKYRHQINSVVNDDTIAWLRLKQGQGQSYQSLSQIVRTLVKCKTKKFTKTPLHLPAPNATTFPLIAESHSAHSGHSHRSTGLRPITKELSHGENQNHARNHPHRNPARRP
jgi:hypothetical protein